VGTPLEWPEAKKVAGHVREWGIEVCQTDPEKKRGDIFRDGRADLIHVAITSDMESLQGEGTGCVTVGR
jgi:hypothetical protein